jgi:patatin-like phospholipase/acyl hydrolase
LVTLLMLEELEKMTGAKTHQMFYLVVETSTGAVIASMMGISCMGAREGLEVYPPTLLQASLPPHHRQAITASCAALDIALR